MPILAGDLVPGTEDATCCADLKNFKCGPGTISPKAESEVDNIVAAACDLNAAERKNMIMRVTREVPPGAVVGVAGLERGDFVFPHPKFTAPYKDAAYVAVIGISEQYRDDKDPFRTKDDGRLGDFLLHDLLMHVKANWRGGMPWVFVAVNPDNDSSVSLFERHDFEYMFRLAPNGDAMFRRPKNLKVPRLP
jgi:ribosomal protein S18 acetylase RimI-like enzyme